MSDPIFQLLALSNLIESDRNPRKTFDQVKLTELAENIKVVGVHTPILVRPLPGRRVPDTSTDVTHEIIAGARRFRASQMAGQLMIPAVIHEMSDNEALEAAIVENLQRDGLSELDEAEGYDALMQHSGLTADEVGKKIGKSRSYVYARLKLLDLCPEARDAMRDGLEHSKALLIARVPTHKLQLRAVEELTRKDHRGDTMSARAAAEWLRTNLMLRLDTAVFDIKDAKLVAGAGACGKCPKRTGANPELFTDVGSADVCTDTSCFNEKVQANSERVVAAARKKGLEVIEGEEAKSILPYPHSTYMPGFDDVDDKVSLDKGASTSLREIATPAELKQLKVLVNPYTHKAIEIIPERLADELRSRAYAAQQKTKPKGQPKVDSAKDEARRLEIERASLSEKYQQFWRERAIAAIEPRVLAEEINRFEPAMLYAIMARLVSGELDENYLQEVIGDDDSVDWYELSDSLKAIRRIDPLKAGVTLLVWLLREDRHPVWEYNDSVRVFFDDAPMIEACAATLAIDLQAIRDEVKAEMRAEFAELEKPPVATPSAAQAEGERGGKAKTGKAKTPAAKKSKTSPEEAMQGIAAAMRGAEGAAASTAADPGAADAAQGNEGAADHGRADQGVMSSTPLGGFRVGQAVRFLDGLKSAGGKMRKVSGRAGTIDAVTSPGRYTVRFGTAAHEVASADTHELELMADAGAFAQDSKGADIELGHRVEVVGDQLTGKWGEVVGLTNGNALVKLDGLSADYSFQCGELKSHGNTKLDPSKAWPFPKVQPQTEAA